MKNGLTGLQELWGSDQRWLSGVEANGIGRAVIGFCLLSTALMAGTVGLEARAESVVIPDDTLGTESSVVNNLD
ncbi:MAG: hypothetical protein KTR27_11935, partial [Leptolyngbyaceae cyanobacterium MAG.088]|nr:hypothetical protein [Leptolyngbyaceae cyanobacterium MAG.088]